MFSNCATGWTTVESWFDFQERQGFYLFSKLFRLTPVLTQLPAQKATCTVADEVKRLRREAGYILTSTAAVRNKWTYASTVSYAIFSAQGKFYLLVLNPRDHKSQIKFKEIGLIRCDEGRYFCNECDVLF